jgi:hypothetical protein
MTKLITTSPRTLDEHRSAIHDAVEVLQQGFLETNDLEVREDETITPESLCFEGTDGEVFTRADLTQQSWIYVARLLFILYAESRGFLYPETAAGRKSYEAELSLYDLQHRIIAGADSREQVRDTHLSTKKTHWMRLDLLFTILDEGDEDLGMRAYEYELFDPEKYPFLSTHPVSDPHLAEVIFLLTATPADKDYHRVDYNGLSPEQVATLCEELPERQLRVALTDLVSTVDESENPGESHE